MHFDATYFALVALVIFIGIILYMKMPAMILKALDDRAAKISAELDAAAKVRADAEALLKEYEKRASEAEAEAAKIVTEAKAEAERLTAETTKSLEEMIVRRTKAAEAKIAQAESQAIADVRARAADLAVAAAGTVLGQEAASGLGAKLISKGIAEVKARLN